MLQAGTLINQHASNSRSSYPTHTNTQTSVDKYPQIYIKKTTLVLQPFPLTNFYLYKYFFSWTEWNMIEEMKAFILWLEIIFLSSQIKRLTFIVHADSFCCSFRESMSVYVFMYVCVYIWSAVNIILNVSVLLFQLHDLVVFTYVQSRHRRGQPQSLMLTCATGNRSVGYILFLS